MLTKKLSLVTASLLGIFSAPLVAQTASAATILFPDFSDVSNLQLNGNATTVVSDGQSVLRLTPSLPLQSGSAFVKDAVSLSNEASFSAFFQFRISNPAGIGDNDRQGADGLVFVIQTVSDTAGGIGGGLGYASIDNSLGIEFDTFDNGDLVDDFDGNHIGVNLNGSIISNPLVPVTPLLNNGTIYSAWIDYNGATDTLEVRFSDTTTRPNAALISKTVDLVNVLEQTDAFVGFTAGTGAGYNDHDILNLTFVDEFAPIVPAAPSVPEPRAILGLLTIGLLGVRSAYNRKQK
ncbi:L-type lectin-domain containing protein [Chroococcus sp. FPU101]|uniref:L-type lectin-domain containing protein n=1 Tax=Chroococcus sp. FPU101 TaxID=1974212 RepID=UPI001A8D086D|nr:L-type lectin-domain containing protein [Chroococcus sp. FPU101]GFE71104.1 putative protein kinase [Chroococcus sp. FPU101]